jgi:hypothetical protein
MIACCSGLAEASSFVPVGAHDQLGHGQMGNAGAAIVGDLSSDRGVAVIDQHVGDRLVDPRPTDDIGQVRLVLGLHDLDQILVTWAD